MIKTILTATVNVCRALARLCGYETAVTLSDHEIEIEIVDPNDRDSKAWDPSHYVAGNVFLAGRSNPVKPTPDDTDDETDLIVSDRYETYMENSLVGDILQADADDLSIKAAVGILASVQCLVAAGLYMTL